MGRGRGITLTLILAPEPIPSPNLRLFRSGLVRHGHRGHDGGAREGVSAYLVRQAQWRRQETLQGRGGLVKQGGGENLLLNALDRVQYLLGRNGTNVAR